VKFLALISRPFQGYQSLKRAFHGILKTQCYGFLESTQKVYTVLKHMHLEFSVFFKEKSRKVEGKYYLISKIISVIYFLIVD